MRRFSYSAPITVRKKSAQPEFCPCALLNFHERLSSNRLTSTSEKNFISKILWLYFAVGMVCTCGCGIVIEYGTSDSSKCVSRTLYCGGNLVARISCVLDFDNLNFFSCSDPIDIFFCRKSYLFPCVPRKTSWSSAKYNSCSLLMHPTIWLFLWLLCINNSNKWVS